MSEDKVDDGGPAFPRASDEVCASQDGMSLRAWLAGQALVGLCASDEWSTSSSDSIAEMAAEQADSIIERLKR